MSHLDHGVRTAAWVVLLVRTRVGSPCTARWWSCCLCTGRPIGRWLPGRRSTHGRACLSDGPPVAFGIVGDVEGQPPGTVEFLNDRCPAGAGTVIVLGHIVHIHPGHV